MGTVRYTTVNGEIIAEKRGGVRKLYVPDPLGSTVALLDNTQSQTDTFTYWPYGEVNTSTGTTPPPFKYVGTLGYYTDDSGKLYVRARYLDAPKGRWLTQDPLGFDGGDTNLYMYANNNPLTVPDPTGKTSATVFCYNSQKPHTAIPCKKGGPAYKQCVKFCKPKTMKHCCCDPKSHMGCDVYSYCDCN